MGYTANNRGRAASLDLASLSCSTHCNWRGLFERYEIRWRSEKKHLGIQMDHMTLGIDGKITS